MVKLKDLFYIEYGSQADLNKLEKTSLENGIRFISRSSENLGFQCCVERNDNFKLFSKGSITVTLGGSYLLSAFIQPGDFYTSQNIKVLTPKLEMCEKEKYFYCYAISQNRFRYTTHGREANKTLDDLIVPSIEEIPTWVYNTSKLPNPKKEPFHKKTVSLSDREWRWFKYDSLFKIDRGKGGRKMDVVGNGKTLFVTSIDSNNGVVGTINNIPVHNGNVLSVNRNGSVGEAYYQKDPFCSTEDVHVYTSKFNLNVYVALFLTTLIKMEKYKFSYGRKWGLQRMRESTINLPVTKEGTPDWQFMEYYIKSLPYSSNLNEMKENKGLTDKQLVEKYEVGEIDLGKTLKKTLSQKG